VSTTWLKIACGAALAVALALAWRFTPLADAVTPDAVLDWSSSFAGHWWAPVVIVLAYTPAAVVLFPRPLITLAAVVSFGPALGFMYAMTGILVASAVGYYCGRAVRRDTVRRLAGKRLAELSRKLRKRGLIAIIAIRLVPLAPFIVESMVAGAIRLKLWEVTVGTFVGMLPGVLTATVLGNEIEAALRDPSTIDWALLLPVLGVLAAATYALRRWLRTTEDRDARASSASR
jgi:uncharacterized membrane protein YdjX (TVP38/TMEM64 family)